MEGLILLDASDTRRRVLQQGLVLAGGALIVSGVVSAMSHGVARWAGVGAVIVGLGLVVAASRLPVRWEVLYGGHVIRFENSVVFGERLYVDGARTTAGALGFRKVIEATILRGANAGERVRAESEAGLVRFRCRITVERPYEATGSR